MLEATGALSCVIAGLAVLFSVLVRVFSARNAAFTLLALLGATYQGLQMVLVPHLLGAVGFLAGALALAAWGRFAEHRAGQYGAGPWIASCTGLLALAILLGRPSALLPLFSSRGGLLYWSPLLWLGYLGFVPLLRRRRGLWPVAAAAAVLTVVLCILRPDTTRAFDSLLPLLAVGLAAALEALLALTARRPGRLLAAAGGLAVLWNALFMQQYRDGLLPRDDTVAFPGVAENAAYLVAGSVGSPVAWPANWVFAAQHDESPARFDRTAGRYVLDTGGKTGVVEVGELETDAALLRDGWSVRRHCGSAVCREVVGTARLFLGLRRRQALDLGVRATGHGTLGVSVNGRAVAVHSLSDGLRDLMVRVEAGVLRHEQNDIVLTVSPGGQAFVDRLTVAAPGL